LGEKPAKPPPCNCSVIDFQNSVAVTSLWLANLVQPCWIFSMVMSLILMLAVGWRIKQDKAKQTPSTNKLRGICWFFYPWNLLTHAL
jgi:hypothetical protein